MASSFRARLLPRCVAPRHSFIPRFSRLYATKPRERRHPEASVAAAAAAAAESEAEEEIPTAGISRPLAEVLKELSKKVPDSVVKARADDGFAIKYVPWHIINRIMNLHAPEWSGEVRSVVYSPEGKSVTVVYRVTLYGTDAEIYRESSGTADVGDSTYGDAVQKAEAMAFRRACARLGLGLHLYHEDL